jgi:hypothetical protein
LSIITVLSQKELDLFWEDHTFLLISFICEDQNLLIYS